MLLMAFITMAELTACNDDEVTDYKEYRLIVASVKLPGILTSNGSNVLADVMEYLTKY